MHRAALVLIVAALVALPVPAVSQVALVFPYGIASGDVRDSSAVLWTRASKAAPVTLEVSIDPAFGSMAFTRTVVPSADRDMTVKIVAGGLAPGKRHFYRFRMGSAFSERGTFATPPSEQTPANLSLAYSACSDWTHVDGAPALTFGLLDAVAAEGPDLFVHLGDTIYADSSLMRTPATTLEGYREKYRESRRIREFRTLLAGVPIVATTDDHEVENDFDIETVDGALFARGIRAFHEYMPLYDHPTGRRYRSFRWGRDVEMFVLDGRSYRSRQVSKTPVCDNPPGSRIPDLAPTAPAAIRAAFAPVVPQMRLPVPPGCIDALFDPNRTLLGHAQKRWLMEGLARSTATWKLVFSQTPIQEFFAMPYDRWEGYAAERAEILGFIVRSNIKNVVWLSSDTHATLVNDVRLSTFTPPFATTGMKEVVAGPIAATLYSESVASMAGRVTVPFLAAFLTTPIPQGGVGLSCAVLDRYAYAKVDVDSAARTIRITPKDASGRPLCRAPVVITAAP